jgi:predicted nucleotidyltransferase
MAAARVDIASALFGKTRRNILALLFGQAGRSFYLREIAARAATGMSQVQKELRQLAAAGLVLSERRANQLHFRANPEAPVYGELLGIVTKTFGIADVLREALSPLEGRIRLAFVYGSIAKGKATAASDIDLFIVGDLLPSETSLPLERVHRRLGRWPSAVIYGTGEFATMLRDEHHFISAVLEGPKIWLIGNEGVLDQLRNEQFAQPRPRRAARR